MKSAASHADGESPRNVARQPFIRTLLGDLPASPALGACDAHEHIVMHSSWLATNFPEFVLADADRALIDLTAFRSAGGGWIVDSMPTGAGRDATLLAQVAQASQVPIVCPTGVHQEQYYPPDHLLLAMTRDPLCALFVDEISRGIDDGAGRLEHRAGVIKVASSDERLTAREIERFTAAALAQQQTGCPILTHTQGGRDAQEQVAILAANGARLSHVVLSHCDRNPDATYHRDLLQTGVCLEYDQHFRQLQRGERCVTADLIAELCDEFPNQLLVGMDLARRRYWNGYGGSPGLAWLMTDFIPMLREASMTEFRLHTVAVENAIRAFTFTNG
ncbi:MAG TPA: hypothetical protein PKC18_16005 [Lacipirellulaceae bacterium]|nr:hypothetical protein [Lacipirellulaceae bacterium]